MTRKVFTFKYDSNISSRDLAGNLYRGSFIKYSGRICGRIVPPLIDGENDLGFNKTYKAVFYVKDTDFGSGFKEIVLSHKENNEKKMREWVGYNTEGIRKKFGKNLHFIDS